MKILNITVNEFNIRNDYTGEEQKPYEEYIFTAKIRIGLHKHYFRFITLGSKYRCAFLDSQWTSPVPKDKELRHQILIKAYGELMKKVSEWRMEETLVRQERERKEEEARKQAEERERRIALGEQVSIEKYLKAVEG